jgi:hypothetical protein
MKFFSILNGILEKNSLIRPIQSILGHPGLFPVIVARLHIYYVFNKLTGYETFEKRQCQNFIQITSNRFSTAVVVNRALLSCILQRIMWKC